MSIHSNGFSTLYTLGTPSANISLSATNYIYWLISLEFIPMSSTGKASHTNSNSIVTAFVMISIILSFEILLLRCLYSRQAKSVCIPSSLLINSLEKVRPGIKPLFFNQNIAQKLPEKKIPSTAAMQPVSQQRSYLNWSTSLPIQLSYG